jgi:hypothetical protein
MPRGLNIYQDALKQGRLLTPEKAALRLSSVLAAWYNADYLTLVDGLVSGARDLTGNGKDGTQGTADNRLTYFPSDSQFGGRTAFGSTSNSGNKNLAVPSITVRHIFQSVRYKDGVDATFDAYSFFAGGPGATYGAYRILGVQYQGYLISTNHYTDVAYKNGITSSSGTVLPLPASVLRFDGSRTQTWEIGGSTKSAHCVFVGGFRNVVFASSVLSTYQIQLIEGVIAWDGGHQGLLVANHPFCNRPPLIGD